VAATPGVVGRINRYIVERTLNITPPDIGRGLSWTVEGSANARIHNPNSRWHEHRMSDGHGGVVWHYTSYRPYEERTVYDDSERPWAEGVATFSSDDDDDRPVDALPWRGRGRMTPQTGGSLANI
jgi:hypothetical protein